MQIREEYRAPVTRAALVIGIVAAQAISDRITRLLTQGGLLCLLGAELYPHRHPSPATPSHPTPPPPPMTQDGRQLANGWRRFIPHNGTFQLNSDQSAPLLLLKAVEDRSITPLNVHPNLESLIKCKRLEAISYEHLVYLIASSEHSTLLSTSRSYRIYQISLNQGETIDNLRWSRCNGKLAIGLLE